MAWRRARPLSSQAMRSICVNPGLLGRHRRDVALGQYPVWTREVAGVPGRIALEVILVLGLGLPERADRREFGHHLAGPQLGGVDVSDGVECHGLLRLVGVEDGRTIGGTQVIALTVLG